LDKPRVTQASFTKANLEFDSDGLHFDYSIKGDTPNWRPKVDRLFDFAELRLGEKDQTIVRIERES